MIFFSILLIIIPYFLNLPSDAIMKAKDIEELEKKAKILACSFLTKSSLISMKNKERQIKDLLKKYKVIQKDSEAKEKIQNFLIAICYPKIAPETANEVLMALSQGNTGLPAKDKYYHLFEFDAKTDFQKFKNVMNEVVQVLKDIEKEEKSLHEKRKDDPELDKSLKDIEKKMVKNKKYTENREEKDEEIIENRENNRNSKKKKGKNQKEEMKQRKDQNESGGKKKLSFKEFIQSLDRMSFWFFIIGGIFIIIFPCIIIETNINNNLEKEENKRKKEEEKNGMNKSKENVEEKEATKNEKNDSKNNEKDIKEKTKKKKKE